MSLYSRLHGTALLAFGGADAGKFLQGQSTCDILALQPGLSTLGAICSAKGRVIAVFHAIRHDDIYFLAVNRTLAERLRQHLSRYVLRAKVGISDAAADYALFGIIGDIQDKLTVNATDWLLPFSIHPPALSLYATPLDRADEAVRQFEWLALKPSDETLWRREILRHGLPDIEAATSEAFIPQMLNFDLLNGISFTKGCYTGQEIVARTHYLGQSKRRMFRLKAASGVGRFTAGDAIRCPDKPDDSIGTVVSASEPDKDGSQELLAVINLADSHSLPTGITVESLPYSVDV